LALKPNKNGSSGTKTAYEIPFVVIFIDFGYRIIVDIKLAKFCRKGILLISVDFHPANIESNFQCNKD
jgi:hypothetical protein